MAGITARLERFACLQTLSWEGLWPGANSELYPPTPLLSSHHHVVSPPCAPPAQLIPRIATPGVTCRRAVTQARDLFPWGLFIARCPAGRARASAASLRFVSWFYVSCRSYPLNSTIHRVYPLAAMCWAASAQRRRRRNPTGYLTTFSHLLIVKKKLSHTHTLFFISTQHPSFCFPSRPASFPSPSPSLSFTCQVPLLASPCLQVFALTYPRPLSCLPLPLSLCPYFVC